MSSDTGDLRAWLAAAERAIKRHRARLDAINVFPVADSDTGTNMYLTLAQGNRAVAKLPETTTHREMVAAFARGALVGARGNSGIIVSQYMSAFLGAIDAEGGLDDASGKSLAAAFEAAADAAYGAVGLPVEGTMLSLGRAAARGARAAADEEDEGQRAKVLLAVVIASRKELAHTREELPVARAAHVVDAGAAGLLLVLEALASPVVGRARLAELEQVEWELAAGPGEDRAEFPGFAPAHSHGYGAGGGAYEVMFMARAPRGAVATNLSEALGTIGDSVAVTGAHGWWHAHVHTDRVRDAVRIGVDARATQVVVRAIANGPTPDDGQSIVVLTRCAGMAADFADAGAEVLVAPDPAAVRKKDLRQVFRDAPGRTSIVVAGAKPLRSAAMSLRRRAKGAVVVTGATRETEVVAALAAAALVDTDSPDTDSPDTAHSTDHQHRSDHQHGALVAAMNRAIKQCVSLEPTVPGLDAALRKAVTETSEVVTLVLSDTVPSGVVDAARAAVAARAPHADVCVYRGGQSSPAILVGIESASTS